jgi:hypothetical protein
MNTILQKRIEEAAEEYANSTTSNLLNVFETTGRFEGFNQGATFALQNQWISVDEELPLRNENITYAAFSEHVLVRIAFEGNIIHRTACYDYANKRWTMYDKYVTHWMPIPTLKGCEK